MNDSDRISKTGERPFRMEKEHSFSLNQDKDLSGKYCAFPFVHAEIHMGGRVFTCCPSWKPHWIGNFYENSLREIWNSELAREERQSILDGNFRFCTKKACSLIQGEQLPSRDSMPSEWKNTGAGGTTAGDLPRTIMLCYDPSCNLSCPSCRVEKVSYAVDTPDYQRSMQLTEKLLSEVFNEPDNCNLTLNITGSGDPFASLVYRHLLESIDGKKFPRLRVDLQTNGLMFTRKMWERVSGLHSNFNVFSVSVDAATEATYSVVRRGGDWNQLLENMSFLKSVRSHFSYLHANFVVQQRNFGEMANFARLFLSLGFDRINFSFINDWGTWSSRDEYASQCIWKTNHPDFALFLKSLNDDIFAHPKINLGNVTEYRRAAISPKPDLFTSMLHHD